MSRVAFRPNGPLVPIELVGGALDGYREIVHAGEAGPERRYPRRSNRLCVAPAGSLTYERTQRRRSDGSLVYELRSGTVPADAAGEQSTDQTPEV